MSPPSIGRVVHYVARGSLDGVYLPVCRAAIVTEVGLDVDEEAPRVALCVLNPTGMFFNLDVPYDAERSPGSWHWPEIYGPVAPVLNAGAVAPAVVTPEPVEVR